MKKIFKKLIKKNKKIKNNKFQRFKLNKKILKKNKKMKKIIINKSFNNFITN